MTSFLPWYRPQTGGGEWPLAHWQSKHFQLASHLVAAPDASTPNWRLSSQKKVPEVASEMCDKMKVIQLDRTLAVNNFLGSVFYTLFLVCGCCFFVSFQ
jgi:hypothetical protein